MAHYYVHVHYETKINDLLIKYVSSYHEAIEYVYAHRGSKMLLFYQLEDITPEEHLSIQQLQWNIQLYQIINNFSPDYLDNIASYLHEIYSYVFATSALSTLKQFTPEHVQLLNLVLNKLVDYLEDDHFISHTIMLRCYSTLLDLAKQHSDSIFRNALSKFYHSV